MKDILDQFEACPITGEEIYTSMMSMNEHLPDGYEFLDATAKQHIGAIAIEMTDDTNKVAALLSAILLGMAIGRERMAK
jgi:hypothetical protein